MKILVVEDDPMLRDGLADLLKGAGHRVRAVSDGASAVAEGNGESYDLVVLDLMLPKMNGIEVCRRVRKSRPGMPILMLTARGAEEEKVRGLKAGADDYVTKPFGARELLARIEALGRRIQGAPTGPDLIRAGPWRFDLGRHEAIRGKQEIPLTPTEVGILRWLHRHRDRVVSREELLEQVWGLPGGTRTRTVDVIIGKLRHKIEDDSARPRLIVSVTGIGYRWGED